MKKILSLMLAVLMCITVAATLISCGHEHVYKTEWSSDATHHWHDCADPECKEPGDKAEHTFDAGTVKSFIATEYKCTACNYVKTENANTTVNADEWTASFDLGENYFVDCDQVFPNIGTQVFFAKRDGNKLTSGYELYYEGDTEATDTSYNFGLIEDNVYYNYYGHHDVYDTLVGYHREESARTPEEEIDAVLSEFLPEAMREMADYTYSAETGYYECAEATAYGQTVQNVKLGFKDAKLVYIYYELATSPENVLSCKIDITYGGQAVTLPTAEQICDHN